MMMGRRRYIKGLGGWRDTTFRQLICSPALYRCDPKDATVTRDHLADAVIKTGWYQSRRRGRSYERRDERSV